MYKFKIAVLTLIVLLIANVSVSAKGVELIDGFYKKIINRTAADGTVKLLEQHYPMICFSKELESKYPKLTRALNDFNEEMSRDAKTERTGMIEQAREWQREHPQFFNGFYSNNDLYIRRADSNVVSLINSFASYSGGVHGMYGWLGVNFNSKTGARLKISDVCTDADRLQKVIVKQLYADYDSRAFDNVEDKVTTMIAQDKINFLVEPRGVTFIFNPYEIAPYASGLLTATIFFDEQPGLFKPLITQTTNAFAQSVPIFHPTTIERKGNRAQMSISNEYDKCIVMLNNQRIEFYLKDIKAATYVQTANGKNYLYIDGYATGDGFSAVEGESISFLKLDGELELYDRMPYTFRHMKDYESATDEEVFWLMTDPNSMRFDSSMPVGDMFSHIGAVNEDGTFSFG